jgi:hypothetical protein
LTNWSFAFEACAWFGPGLLVWAVETLIVERLRPLLTRGLCLKGDLLGTLAQRQSQLGRKQRAVAHDGAENNSCQSCCSKVLHQDSQWHRRVDWKLTGMIAYQVDRSTARSSVNHHVSLAVPPPIVMRNVHACNVLHKLRTSVLAVSSL